MSPRWLVLLFIVTLAAQRASGAGLCNGDPLLIPSIYALHKTFSPADLADKVASDPAYASALGNPTVLNRQVNATFVYAQIAYPPLVDPDVEFDRLVASGEFSNVRRNGRGCFPEAPPDSISTFVEFYHPALDHYFYSGNASEIAAIDAGNVGTWVRTGKSFRAVTEPGCAFSTPDTTVYRFFGKPGVGPNSHFFTRDRAECYVVDKSAQWELEGVPFWASPLQPDGTCPVYISQRVPLYRAWRPFGDSNHRFTTDRAVVAQMVAKGWVDEGAAMCVLPSS